MLRITQIKLAVTKDISFLKKEAARVLAVHEEEIQSLNIIKRSVDARKKPNIFYVYTVDVQIAEEEKILKRCKNNQISTAQEKHYELPECGTEEMKERPVIIGSGPAGLFCALALAKKGFHPLLLERGASVLERQEQIDRFWKDGVLNTVTNVQFGEGGAGTFSDGKLNTAVKDPTGRNGYVLRTFVEAGAPEEILWINKPHIGTDILRDVIRNIRHQIEELGGEVRFYSQVTDILSEQGKLTGLEINKKEILPCSLAVLAIGHSARDTFKLLKERTIEMEQKSFAVGVRVEHPQQMIDDSQYGKGHPECLPAADYKLTCQLPNKRGVYSFCMCPGGYVVNASSEEGMTAVNGMSYHARNGENANSAIVVTVTPDDFEGTDILAGMEFQRKLEKLAYQEGNGKVPVQMFSDFIKNRPSSKLGAVTPCIRGQWTPANVKNCFPKELSQSIEDGIHYFGRKIKGFDAPQTLLSGVETRTSSPVRIVRDESLQSSIRGLYPCGEGAGYAGGITSAAMDGLKVAETILKKFKGNGVYTGTEL